MNRSVVTVSIGGVAMLFGITVMLLSSDLSDKVAGGIICLLGLCASMWSYTQVLADDRKELDRQRNEMRYTERMSSGIETMNKNINALIEEIREDRKQRNKGKDHEDNTAGHSKGI